MTPDENTASSTGPSESTGSTTAPVRRTRRRAASRPAGPPEPIAAQPVAAPAASSPAALDAGSGQPPTAGTASPETSSTEPAPAKKSSRRRGGKKAAATEPAVDTPSAQPTSGEAPAAESSVAEPTVTEPTVSEPTAADGAAADSTAADATVEPVKKTASRRRSRKAPVADPFSDATGSVDAGEDLASSGSPAQATAVTGGAAPSAISPVFQAPDAWVAPAEPSSDTSATDEEDDAASSSDPGPSTDEAPSDSESSEQAAPTSASARRRRSRGGRNRRKSTDATADESTGADGGAAEASSEGESAPAVDSSQQEASTPQQPDESKEAAEGEGTSSSSRRRRRRRRSGDSSDAAESSGDTKTDTKTVVKVREPRPASDSITSVEGSTRIEAKKQRRREGREAGRRRAPILSESEFLARRESVDRVMVIRQRDDVTQIAVLEDDVLVEHYVALDEQSSLIGNVYLGRVQNVLPSMEAAFIDIGKGRNAVLYAGEVNWDLIGDRNQPRRIENALKPGQQILVQVSKDPVGHKGARLTSQISLPGRYLVYVPGGGSSGISRKLPDTERNRLKNLLKDILPDESGVIVRTAAEGASEEELTRDVTRLTARWDEISKLVKTGKGPTLLYAEPDITLKVVRDLFTEDFARLVISGDEAWDIVNEYVSYVAPDLAQRLVRYDGQGDIFANFRVDEQIAKALERKVWLPSGGSLVIDRTEAMTVVDVNTGKFTGSGGNLEQTVTKNNLEAAEEIVRQLRLRDIGGIIVIDFIDMVLENNRDLVLRRLVECLGRDRTRHQVAEVTSLGLVQMTRKRIGTGLVEAFSVPCEVCHGRGVVIESEPVKSRADESAHQSRSGSSKRSSGRSRSGSKSEPEAEAADPLSAERHSAAAAATAAIAAALHLEAKPAEAEPLPEAAPEPELPDGSTAAEPATAKKTTSRSTTRKTSTKKASTSKKSATTKRATAKKTTTAKSAAAAQEAAPDPVGATP